MPFKIGICLKTGIEHITIKEANIPMTHPFVKTYFGSYSDLIENLRTASVIDNVIIGSINESVVVTRSITPYCSVERIYV